MRGNFIGTNAGGDAGLGNTGSGIYIDGPATPSAARRGDRNVIAGNLIGRQHRHLANSARAHERHTGAGAITSA